MPLLSAGRGCERVATKVEGDPVGRLVTVSPDGALVFDRRFRLKPTYNIECYGIQPTTDDGWILACGYGVRRSPQRQSSCRNHLGYSKETSFESFL